MNDSTNVINFYITDRESDNPVPLDSELCAEILRSLEDAPDCDDKRGNDTGEHYTVGNYLFFIYFSICVHDVSESMERIKQ